MELIEIRDLDGPNLFLLEPAIKVEFRQRSRESALLCMNRLRHQLGLPDRDAKGSSSGLVDIGETLANAVELLHQKAGLPPPRITWQALETEAHLAIAYSWSHRRGALRLAELLAALVSTTGVDLAQSVDAIKALTATATPDDQPLMITDAERRIPIVGVTGTNGKTTTTRLISHILRVADRQVGWSSSSGVYINGELVLEGDYTGPAGARRVLDEPDLDIGVLETARGGILLRGIAYESNDVGVFTNVSGDHLDLQGIRTLDGLTRVKSTVVRVTRTDGFAVLNADDERVRAVASDLRATVFYVSQTQPSDLVDDHIAAGGPALIVRDQEIVLARDGAKTVLMPLNEAPITFNGRARHMVENVLCAAAACLALGLTESQVRNGLRSFKSDPLHNLGRLNLFSVGEVQVVVDFAHNESGLRHLLSLAHELVGPGADVHAIIGTAGDRTDDSLAELGRLAARQSDRVYIKETGKYLRGRANNEEINRQYIRGLAEVGATPWTIEADELTALTTALAQAGPGDVIAMMCVEQVTEIVTLLGQIGQTVP